MPSTVNYFEKHLANLMHTPLLEGYENYSMDCSIHFRDTAETWALFIDSGCLCEARRADIEEPPRTVRFVVDEPIFWDIVNGSISPQKAFFTRRTDIKGNVFEGMKLAKLLSLFFAAYPYREKGGR